MKIHFNSNTKNYLPSSRSSEGVLEFHWRMPDYKPSPLISLPHLANRFKLGEISVKAETSRFGLAAFKILGASFAVWKVLQEKFSIAWESWHSIDQLRELVRPYLPLKFVSATDGNHGRGVARMAGMLNIQARIFLPTNATPARIAAIASEGAEVTVVDGSYDDAVSAAEETQSDRAILIQDTSQPGYEKVNNWIIEGYSTIFQELELAGYAPPDFIFVQIGVGSLAASVIDHYKPQPDSRVKVISVEPMTAACALESVEKGEIIQLTSRQDTIMAGLNCGTPSAAAWEALYHGIDCFLAIEDDWSAAAMRELATVSLHTSESGAAGLAGLMALCLDPLTQEYRNLLALNDRSRILLLITEGIIDAPVRRKTMEVPEEPNYNF